MEPTRIVMTFTPRHDGGASWNVTVHGLWTDEVWESYGGQVDALWQLPGILNSALNTWSDAQSPYEGVSTS